MKRVCLILLSLLGIIALPASAQASTVGRSGGYWMLTQSGQVFEFGGAGKLFSTNTVENPGSSVHRVDIEATSTGNGYWILGNNGSITQTGDAKWLGSGSSTLMPVGESFVSMSSTPSSNGYWLFTNKGRVFNYGDAPFLGDLSGVTLAGPVLGSVATPSGNGYYMVASDGGIFSFGDAAFHGSMGGRKLSKPVMSMSPDSDGMGYWLVASDGGIFAFDADFFGSMGATKLAKPVTGMVPSPTGHGYLMVAGDGGIFTFGDVPFYGSLGANPPSSQVVAVTAIGPVAAHIDPPKPSPIFGIRSILSPFFSTGEAQTAVFSVSGSMQTLVYSCNPGNGAYSYGCSFEFHNASTGELVDMFMPDAFTNPTTREYVLHLTPGSYYITGDEFGDQTIWGAAVNESYCTANC